MVLGVIIATVIVGVTGCLIGFFLCFSSFNFKIDVDERETAVLEALPGNNCGGCGYAGCSGLASAIVKGEAPVNQCPVGGEPVGKEIASIMGVDAGVSVHKVAYVKCNGTCENAKTKYEYTGVEDCNEMSFVPGNGPKSCSYGCLGYGSCVKACPFDAIHIVDGVALVDKEACKACGKCVVTCPRQIIELIPYQATEMVTCSNKDKGKAVMDVCSVGCIACHLCEKNCESDAIHVIDDLAVINQSKCIGCQVCVTKCPKKTIQVIGA